PCSLYPDRPLYFFFFNHTAPTEIYTLSLHDALPISRERALKIDAVVAQRGQRPHQRVRLEARRGTRLRAHAAPFARGRRALEPEDRKSTRLNSSHLVISYAVFCLKKKKKKKKKSKKK